jgi:glycosyltransferase involved in cell wall biosynthesis
VRFAFISTMNGSLWGGSEELWGQAALQLKNEGHEVLVFIIHWKRESPRIAALAKAGIEIEELSERNVGRARRVWNKIAKGDAKDFKRLKQFNPHLVVISQGHNSGGFDWAKTSEKLSVPYTLIVQCNGDNWWFGEQLGEAIESYSNARRVFCVSQANLDLLRMQVGEPLLNAEVVQNPFNVSTEPAPAWPDMRGNLRMAVMARLHIPSKGQDLLLRAIASPEWKGRPIELNLYGAGPDEHSLRRMVKKLQLENVNFCGHVNDIRSVWEHNHILVLPSRYEGLPLALVEAMWCGRPAVLTDVGGNAELCVNGETGFVASSATLSSFANALQQAWARREEWEQMGRAARARVEKVFPRDPIGLFCERLKNCAAGESEAQVVGQVTAESQS